MTVCIGEIFLEFVNMLPAFQTYCLQQSSSVNMLNALEKEKELLRWEKGWEYSSRLWGQEGTRLRVKPWTAQLDQSLMLMFSSYCCSLCEENNSFSRRYSSLISPLRQLVGPQLFTMFCDSSVCPLTTVLNCHQITLSWEQLSVPAPEHSLDFHWGKPPCEACMTWICFPFLPLAYWATSGESLLFLSATTA